MNNDGESYLVRSDDGTPVGRGMVYKLGASRVGGTMSLFEGVLPPGMLVDLHTHANEDECSYVLAGELTFFVGDQELQAGPGSYVVKPRNVPHALWNRGKQPARVLEITAPGNLDDYYPQLMALFAGTPSLSPAVRELAERYGIRYHVEATATLRSRLQP